jgi:hypothetical protein
LFYDRYQEPLPADYGVSVYALDGLALDDSKVREAVEKWLDTALAGEQRAFGEGVFSVSHQVVADDPFGSAWIMLVYDRVAFLAITARTDDLSNGPAAA